MAAKRKTPALVKHSVECQCGEVITARFAEDLDYAKMEHMYQQHPLEFAKGFVKAIPKVRDIGAMVGNFLRENMK